MGGTITLLLTKRKIVVIKAEKSLVLVLNMLIICLNGSSVMMHSMGGGSEC